MIGYTEISLSLSLFLSKKKWSGHIDSDAQTDRVGHLDGGFVAVCTVQRSFLTCLSTSKPTHRTGRKGTI